MKKQLLFLVMLFIIVTTKGLAVEIEINGLRYNLIEKEKIAKVIELTDNEISEVVIPSIVEYGGEEYQVTHISGFSNHTSIISVTIPNTITSIGAYAFSGCSNLKSIIIPKSVMTIGSFAFSDCYGLSTVIIEDAPNMELLFENSGYRVSTFKDCHLNKLYIGRTIYYWPLNVSPFRECSVDSVIIGADIAHSYTQCYAMFEKNPTLSYIEIKDGVTKIPSLTFANCDELKEIFIPKSVTEIDRTAFQGCAGLKKISVDANNQTYDSRDNCNAVIHISSNTLLLGCSKTIIPNSITTIGAEAFHFCDGLDSIIIPDNITTLENYAFRCCSRLKTVYIGESVKLIKENVFANCENMKDVYCKNIPSTFASNIFENTDIVNATLHVPSSLIEYFKLVSPWKDFGKIVELTCYQLKYVVDGTEYKSYDVEYGATITPEAAPAKEGYTFSGWSEIPETMPAHDVTVTGTFTINKYKLTYTVDGEEYKSYEVEYGAIITAEPAPTKEGYTFSGWSEIPETMPAHDVTVTGTFSINKYKLTYVVDGAEYKTYEIEYGAAITPEAEPTKEGYTFSGWSEIPETMPAHDVKITGTFTKGEYKLTYYVDGVVYKTVSYDYGATITPETEPTKEGYTFSGWSEIPETMPAHDVTITGTFSINKYKLTYTIDGEEYKTYEVEFGATITPEAAPTKEGYTFSGWSEIPETMPAHNVTVTGTFTINKYKLTYIVDGAEYKTYEVEYGATITPEAEPIKEGYTFSGWSEIPQTMPAHDVTVTGAFNINSYKLTYMIDDKVYKEMMYEYGATITPEPQPEGDYQTFEWTDLPQTMPAHDVVVYASYTSGIIEVLMASQHNVRIYSPNGKKLNKLQKGLNIVIFDDGTVKKVMMK